MCKITDYVDKFFIEGRIIVEGKDKSDQKKTFNNVLKTLHVQHREFVERCTKEKILKIDEKTSTIELLM